MYRILVTGIFILCIACSHDNTQINDVDYNVIIVLQFPDDLLVNEIKSYRVSVTATDIVSPVEEISSITPMAGINDTITAYVPDGAQRNISIYFNDQQGSVIFWGKIQSDIEGEGSDYVVISIRQSVASTATRIKVLRDNLPWNSDALDNVLADIGLSLGTGDEQYQVITSDAFDTVSLESGEDLVIVANDQSQEFYDNYSSSQPKIEAFIANGGTILWEACDLGWARGSIDSAGIDLPGDVETIYGYENTNYITSSLYSITSGLDSILTENYASHEGFINLPEGALVYCRDSRHLPTLVSFSSGEGWVILTGQPLEYNYQPGNASTPGALLPRIIRHVLGYEM